ncbi:MAG: Gfo/Idh/MocA family oxidoreductase, partial [Candidatus Brocadiia bacterium]
MSTNDKVRYAVIGCGVIGPVHADAVCRSPSAELVAACDVVPERARQCADTYGGTPYSDYAQMLKAQQPEAVSICTPHHNHAEIAVGCLEAGAAVLCEKPLAIRREDLDRMAQAAARNGRPLGGIFQHRFDRAAGIMREALAEGLFGHVLTAGVRTRVFRGPDYYGSAAWRGTWDGEGGGVLINQAIHSIDMLQWLAGPVVSIFGRWTNRRLGDCIETEDTASAALEFADGAMGYIEATASSHCDFRSVVDVCGTEGDFTLSTAGEGRVTELSLRDDAAERELRDELDAAEEADRAPSPGKSCYGDSHRRQVAEFVDAVLEDRPPAVTASKTIRRPG